ncbi:MAG: riboflavin biosynthesis protein RibF, partial [Anaerolineae bacterium]
MQHYRSLKGLSIPASWLTIGVFDGVHRGHREILRHLVTGAHEENLPAVVLTFYPHPAIVLGKDNTIRYLTLPEEKASLLGDLGVDIVVTHPFDQVIASLPAEKFMQRLKAHLGVRRLVEGDDFALGKDRQGNIPRLIEIGKTLGYEVQTIPTVLNGEERISSRLIRSRLAAGQVAEAAAALGRYYTLSGPVVHGDGRGRKIDIPTANIAYPAEKVIPANGVYACWAWVGGRRHPAVTNIGLRPTFTPQAQHPHIETHLLDFRNDLYGQHLTLEFVARLREEKRFPSV